jgi:hypothetical protein
MAGNKGNLIGTLLAFVVGAFVCRSLTADQVKFVFKPDKSLQICLQDALPQRNIDPSKDAIPSFLTFHRVWNASGKSRPRLLLVDKDGQTKAAPQGMKKLPRAKIHQYPGSNYVYPSEGWHIKIEGHDHWPGSSSLDRWKITYRKAPGEKAAVTEIPDLADSWNPEPIMYDDDSATLYFLTTEGGTGNRQSLFVRFVASTGKFSIVGLSAGRVVVHPLGHWILWQPGGLAEVGGKHLYTTSLSMFNVTAGESLILTSGAIADAFDGWCSE